MISSSSGSTLQYAHFFAGGVRRAGSKGFNTEETGRTTEFTEQKSMALRAKRRDSCLLRELRGPPNFLRVGILAFLNQPRIRTDANVPGALVPHRQAAAGERETAGRRTEPNSEPRTRRPLARLGCVAVVGLDPTRVALLSRAGALSLAAALLSRHIAPWPDVIAGGAGSKSGLVKQARA